MTVNRSTNPETEQRVAALLRKAANNRHFRTTAGGEDFCKDFIVKNSKDLVRDFRTLVDGKILCGLCQVLVGGILAVLRRNIGQRLHQPMHHAAFRQGLLAIGRGYRGADHAPDVLVKCRRG